MGILRLFSYLSRRYNNIIKGYKNPYHKNKSTHKIEKNDKIENEYTPSCEIVLLDLNAIFHPCAQKVFEYGSGAEKKSLFLSQKKKAMSYEELETIAFNTICNKIDELVRVANPSKCIYLAIDGVPGIAKQSQQRQRRFRSAMNSKEKEEGDTVKPLGGFDPNCITTGTEFMARLCNHIYHFIKKKKRFEWSRLRIIYNNMFVPSEGEHKLVRYLDQNSYGSICIMSPDADLIMLSLSLLTGHCLNTVVKEPKITILRENVFQHVDGDYLFVDTNQLKKNLIDDLNCVSMNFDFNNDLIIRDFVFFCFFIGNDFLPNVNSLEISNKGIEILFKVYCDTWTEQGYLVKDVAKKFYINKEAMVLLLKNLASLEVKMLLDKADKGYAKYTDKVMNRHLIRDERGLNVKFESYKEDFYRTKFGFEKLSDAQLRREIDKICEEYLLGMIFVLKYYFKSIPDFGWYYPYHYAPFFSDLTRVAEGFDFYSVKFQPRRPLTMYESLVGIMPPSSFHLLPETLREELPKKIQLDADFLEEFEIDLDGKINDYEAILLLPFLSYEKIKKLTQNIKLTEEEEKKSKIGTILMF